MSRNSVVLLTCLVVLLATAPVFAQAPPRPGLAVTVNTSHALLRGLQDWWRVVPQWYGGTTWRNLMLRNDLTLTTMTAAGAGWGPSSAPGSSGEMRFTGAASEALLGSTGMVGDNTAFTVIVGYRSSTQARQYLYMDEGSATNSMKLYLYESVTEIIYFTMRDDVTGCCLLMSYNSSTPLDGFRHYIGVVQAAKDNRKLYLDGVEVASDTAAIATLTGLSTRRLGNSTSGSSTLNGAIEEAFVYTRALSAAEMMQLVQSAKQGHPTLLTRGAQPLSLLFTGARRAGGLLPFFLK